MEIKLAFACLTVVLTIGSFVQCQPAVAPGLKSMPNSYTDALAAPDREQLLDAIFELESSSGRNPKAYFPDKFGSLGGYQMRESTFGDLQRIFPSKWGKVEFKKAMLDNNTARMAASDYVNVIQNFLSQRGVPPTADNLLAAYNAGMGNVVKKKVSPEGQLYAKRGLDIMKRKSNGR